jgi:hypothetical protein
VSVIEDARVLLWRFIDQEEPETTGDLVDTIAVTGWFDLTDAQWAVLEPLLPTAKRPGRVAIVLDGLSAPPALRTGCAHGTPWFVARLGSERDPGIIGDDRARGGPGPRLPGAVDSVIVLDGHQT